MHPLRVLFLCTGNSCRSQMAEGFLRATGGKRFDAVSAGAKPSGAVHPLAVTVMQEVGIDLSRHRSKPVNELADETFDFVITVCDHAREACPVFPAARDRLHWSFDDPAAATGSDAQKHRVFRRVRDEIRHRVRRFVEAYTA